MSDLSRIRIETPAAGEVHALVALWRGTFVFHHALDPVYYVPDSKSLANELEAYLLAALRTGRQEIRVARGEDGEPLGLIVYAGETEDYPDTRITRFVLVTELFVTDQARGLGVGRALMAEAEAWGRARGLAYLKLAVASSNLPALAFYERLGFADRQRLLYKPIS
jgi:ribosomal protein S18 acetylase RimI-like enzyme